MTVRIISQLSKPVPIGKIIYRKFRAIIRKVNILHFIYSHKRLPKKITDPKRTIIDILYYYRAPKRLGRPLQTQLSDKYLVKNYINSYAGEKYSIPTKEIFLKLEEMKEIATFSGVLKPTHLTGEVVFVNGSLSLEIETLVKKWLNTNLYHISGEANYKSLVPRVIYEPLIFESDDLEDFKCFCFHGEPKFFQVDSNRRTKHVRSFYDLDWRRIPVTWGYPSGPEVVKPRNLSEMITVASDLSSGVEFLRVDFFSNGDVLFVGELTNLHGNNVETFGSTSEEKKLSKFLLSK